MPARKILRPRLIGGGESVFQQDLLGRKANEEKYLLIIGRKKREGSRMRML